MGNDKSERSVTTAGEVSHFRLYSLFLFGICVICYFNSLENKFCFDDGRAITKNYDLRPSTPFYELFRNDFWGKPIYKESSHKSYRPLCVLTFRWNYAIHGLDPAGYHFAIIVLHLALCILIMYVFQMFMSEWLAFIMAVHYMVHPVHTEAVTGVVGRAEILSAIFMLIAFKCYALGSGYRSKTRWKCIYLSVLMVVVATLCKEQGVTVIAICCSYEVFWLQKAKWIACGSCMELGIISLICVVYFFVRGLRQQLSDSERRISLWKALHLAKLTMTAPNRLPKWFRTSLGRMIVLLVTTTGFMILRIYVMGAELPHFNLKDNPSAKAQTPARQLTQWYLLPFNMWLLLYPFPLLCDYSTGTIPLLKSFTDPRNLATIIFVTVMGLVTWFAVTANTKTARQVSTALAFLVFPFLPATNLFFPVGFVVAERILYVPSMGFSMIVVIGMKSMFANKRFRKVVYTLFIITVLLHGAKTARRNIDWKSDKALFMSGLFITSTNSKLWKNVGVTFKTENEPEKAIPFFEKSSMVPLDNGDAFISLGKTYAAMNMDELAMENFQKAEVFIPPKIPGERRILDANFASIYLSMAAIVRKNKTRYPEALALYEKAMGMRKEYKEAYIHMGDLFMQMGEMTKAEQTYRKLLEFEPRSEDGLYNMGIIASKRNNSEEALQWFEMCLVHHPKSKKVLFEVALLKEAMEGQKTELQTEQLDRFLNLYDHQKDNPLLAAKIGMMYKEMNDLKTAEKFLREALDMDNKLLPAMFNLGQTYRLMNDNERSLEVLEKYVKLRTDNANAWLLLGELYGIHRNDNDAAWRAFEEARKIKPDDPHVIYNFCVTFVRRRQYMEGLECLEKLAEKSPRDFVLENLRKLKDIIEKKKNDGEL